jgi:hypothetical protein
MIPREPDHLLVQGATGAKKFGSQEFLVSVCEVCTVLAVDGERHQPPAPRLAPRRGLARADARRSAR